MKLLHRIRFSLQYCYWPRMLRMLGFKVSMWKVSTGYTIVNNATIVVGRSDGQVI